MSLVEQELLTLPEHLSSPPLFSGVRVTRSLVLYVCFVHHCSSFCLFSFGHCVVFFDIWILITPLVSSNSSFIFVVSNNSQFSDWNSCLSYLIFIDFCIADTHNFRMNTLWNRSWIHLRFMSHLQNFSVGM